MTKTSIKYVIGNTICLEIDEEIYYIKEELGLHKIYDSLGNRVICNNIDKWISMKTMQKCSYSNIKDMALAFIAGAESQYSQNDISTIIKYYTGRLLKTMYSTNLLYELSLIYWIEILGERQIIKYVNLIGSNLDNFIVKVGKENLSNNLLRLYRISQIRNSQCVSLCEKILNKLGLNITEPSMPDGKITNEKFLKYEKEYCDKIPKFKNVFKSIVEMANDIESRRL